MGKIQIPKMIHCCWFGGNKMSDDIIHCIESWKKQMPEYAFILWNEDRFDINSHLFVQEAFQAKKWAFVSDYVRLYALYTQGGIYLDTDVFVKKSFNDFLDHGFFTAVEYHQKQAKNGVHLLNKDGSLKNKNEMVINGIQLQAAIMGGVQGHPFFKSCMDWYQGKHFILEDGSYANKAISPDIFAYVATQYGFRYKNEFQKLNHNMVIYPNTVFAGSLAQETEESYAVHRCEASWRNKRYMLFWKLRKNNFLRMLFGKKKLKKL